MNIGMVTHERYANSETDAFISRIKQHGQTVYTVKKKSLCVVISDNIHLENHFHFDSIYSLQAMQV